jgi:DNA-binding transcriptional MerR regulator
MAEVTASRQFAPSGLSIGELSTRTGRSVHTIRWYEAQGLIPGVTRDRGGRRVYNQRHLSWLDLIDRLRRTGMSIAQIREYAALVKQGTRTLRQQQKLLSAHRARIKKTIAEWTLALKLIDHKIDFYGEWLSSGRKPSERRLKARWPNQPETQGKKRRPIP